MEQSKSCVHLTSFIAWCQCLECMELYIHALNTPPRRATRAQVQPSFLDFPVVWKFSSTYNGYFRSMTGTDAAVVTALAWIAAGWNGSTWQTNPTSCAFLPTQHGRGFRLCIYNQELEQNVHCQRSNKKVQKSIRYQVSDNLLHLVQTCDGEQWTTEMWPFNRQFKVTRQ